MTLNYDNSSGMSYLNAPREKRPKLKSAPSVERYTLFVKTLKLLFPLTALVIIGIVVSYMTVEEQGYMPDVTPAQTAEEKTTPGEIELLGAKYEGVDETGKAYTITADRANRTTEGEDQVEFEKPLTDIFLDDNTWLALKSEGGFFNRMVEKLILEQGVKAFHDSGYEIDMRDIEIDMKTRSAFTSQPVKVQGPAGSAEARSMTVMSGGEKVVFQGPVKLQLFNLSLLKGKK